LGKSLPILGEKCFLCRCHSVRVSKRWELVSLRRSGTRSGEIRETPPRSCAEWPSLVGRTILAHRVTKLLRCLSRTIFQQTDARARGADHAAPLGGAGKRAVGVRSPAPIQSA